MKQLFYFYFFYIQDRVFKTTIHKKTVKTEKAVVETTISPARSESAPLLPSLAMVKEATAVGAAVTQRYETSCSEEKFKYYYKNNYSRE